MKYLIIFSIWTLSLSPCIAQEEIPEISIDDMGFIEGKWKAVSKDSSFSSILDYRFSPEGRLLMATNHLYGKDGKLFGVYEGAYFIENDRLVYFLSGPKGETHKGIADIKIDTIVHMATITPGTSVKSYLSEMVLRNNQLFYFANYSKKMEYPEEVDHSSPLIYNRFKE